MVTPSPHAQPLRPGREKLRGRNKPFQSRLDWMKDLAHSDQEALGFDGRYWVVKNKVYDLTNYLKSHPGGPGESAVGYGHWLSSSCQPIDNDDHIIHDGMIVIGKH